MSDDSQKDNLGCICYHFWKVRVPGILSSKHYPCGYKERYRCRLHCWYQVLHRKL